MTADSDTWEVRLSDAANADLREILLWTVGRFGARQAESYAEFLSTTIKSLSDGPGTIGARKREDLGPGIFVLPAGRSRAKGRHLIIYRPTISDNRHVIDVLRVLHHRMDLVRHLSGDGPA